jgi:choline dehydrogenase-like flavoprotein
LLFDYVIVGGGLAGCVVAARLSERPEVRVALIEAGGENLYEPSYYANGAVPMFATDANWGFVTEPQTELAGARVPQHRGKVIGGSAAINIGSWSRGIAQDYDAWTEAGAAGWGWTDALRTFEAMETSCRPDGGGRGRSGPLILEDTPVVSEMTALLRQACIEAGYGATADHNGAKLEGFDLWETIFPSGRRRNSAEAYLAPARCRNNLTVITGALATRIDVAGGRATGVVIEVGRETRTVVATREVVLCAGVYGTPQLLMLSGIGPGAHLRAHNIDVVADVAGVGANLIDHLATQLGWAAAEPTGIAQAVSNADDSGQLESWRHTGYGPLSENAYTSIAFVRSTNDVALPDIELLFGVNPPQRLSKDAAIGGFAASVTAVQPRSRGVVTLRSPDPHDAPVIDPRYLSDAADLPVLTAGIRKSLALAEAPSLSQYTARCDLHHDASDEEIAAWIRGNSGSMYHPVGTSRMGSIDDDAAVLDPQLRVRGIDGLRVVDASAMPDTIRGHMMAPTLYIAERGSALIRQGSPT